MGLSEILQELRGERALSQKQLAEAIGVSQSTIAKIELGRNEATASTVRKLAKYFGVSADYLLGLEDEFGAKTEKRGIYGATNAASAAEERELVKQFRRLAPFFRKTAVQTVKLWADNSAANDDKTKK